MLKPVKASKARPSGASFAIVASRYNSSYVDAMVDAATQSLKKAGIERIKIVRVPGAFEIPAVAAKLLWSDQHFDAIICLGVVLRGQTVHAQLIGESVSSSLAQLQIQHAVPIIHEVLLLENEEQARVRCLGEKHNRGSEAAHTALEMARVMRALDPPLEGGAPRRPL